MRVATIFLALATTVSIGASAAQAQPTVGHATCIGSSGTVAVDVTGYLLDLQSPNSTGTGGGAGKLPVSQAEVEMAASNFASLASLMTSGQVFSSCELTTYDASGLKLELKMVQIIEAKLLAGSSRTGKESRANSAPVLRAILNYTGLTIQSNSQSASPMGVTSGGGSLNNGWNRVANQNP